MDSFIKLRIDRDPYVINKCLIESLTPFRNGTLLTMSSGMEYIIDKPFNVVAEALLRGEEEDLCDPGGMDEY